VGELFPSLADAEDKSLDFAVLSIAGEEADAEWRSGFYRFNANVMDLDAALRALQL
jgi:hypothetical protein